MRNQAEPTAFAHALAEPADEVLAKFETSFGEPRFVAQRSVGTFRVAIDHDGAHRWQWPTVHAELRSSIA